MHEEAGALLDARAQQGLKATAEEAIHWGGLKVLFRLHDEIQCVTRLPHELEQAIEEYLANLTPPRSAEQP